MNMRKREEIKQRLELACGMWDDPLVYFYQQLALASRGTPSIFLAGPTSRDEVLEYKWRIFAVHFLRTYGFSGVIYVPEAREDDWSFKKTFPKNLVTWEQERVMTADVTMVWFDRHQVQLPGRLTGFEGGFLAGMAYASPSRFEKRLVVGSPPNAWKVRSEQSWVTDVAGLHWHDDLEAMCRTAIGRLPA
jgi:hypothetical protein